VQSAKRLNDKNQKLFKDRLFESGFDYTDIVKCDGEFFLNSAFLDFALQYNISTVKQQERLITDISKFA
jgi:hypothetical protein